MTSVHTTCPYCGVGCGVIARSDGAIVPDPEHPANFGRICSKGAALAATLNDSGRLLRPVISGRDAPRNATWDEALDLAAARFRATIAAHGPDSVAFYVSGQCLTEDYYAANKLMKGFIGSANIDTNSRLCMASSVVGHVRAFGEDIVPGIYEDWEQADLAVLVGSNTAWCHPVLYQRLLAAKAKRGTRIVVIDPRRTATADAADLHLPIASGSDVALFNGLLVYLAAAGKIDPDWTRDHTSGLTAAITAATIPGVDPIDRAADECGVDPELVETFYDLFAKTTRALTVYSQGVNQSSAGTDKVNAILNVHLATGRIGRPGMGPFSVTGQPNAMGGREVGGLANQLAAHMRFDDKDDRAALQDFWRSPTLAPKPGLKAVDMFDAVADGRIKAIWIMATNPADSMPRADKVREALAACPFVVVSDCWATDTTAFADVVLPAAGWGEKDGTVTNSERRISRQRPFRAAPGDARPDWWQFAEIGRRMGWPDAFAWTSPADVFREHAALSGHANNGRRVFDISALAGISSHEYDTLRPILWPAPAAAPQRGGRLFAEGGFSTPDGRARFVPVTFLGRPDHCGQPLLVNTGRIRDQWHTMTRTGLAPNLMMHTPEPLLTVHPADAAAAGVENGGLVRLITAEGTIILRASTDHSQRRGEVFAPMHWTDQFGSSGPVGRIVTSRVDPYSGQPELKATPASITPVSAYFHGLLLRRMPGPLPDICHWTRVPLPEGHLYRLSGLDLMPCGQALDDLAASLLRAPERSELLVASDPGRGTLRIAALCDGVVAAALFLAQSLSGLPPDSAVIPILGAPVADSARLGLLSGKRYDKAATEGPRVCACFGVTRDAVRHAVVTHRLQDTRGIGEVLSAGTNCGSCLPELEEILRDVRVPA